MFRLLKGQLYTHTECFLSIKIVMEYLFIVHSRNKKCK